MKSNLVKVSALIAGLSIATATVSVTKVAEAVPQDGKLKFVQDTQSETQLEVIKEQTGQLKIVNDTPFITLVQLYQPNAEQAYRYANVPPCTVRSLSATYSNLWQVSVNTEEKKPIYEVSNKRGNTFAVITSKLNKDKKWTCNYKPVAQDVAGIPFNINVSEGSKKVAYVAAEYVNSGVAKSFPNVAEGINSMRKDFFEGVQSVSQLPPGHILKYTELTERPVTNNNLKAVNTFARERGGREITLDQYKEINKTQQVIHQTGKQYYYEPLPKDTNPNISPYTGQPSELQDGTDGFTNVSIKGTSFLGIITTSVISKNDVFRVSSIIDFSKWYAPSQHLSKPVPGAYNVALLSN